MCLFCGKHCFRHLRFISLKEKNKKTLPLCTVCSSREEGERTVKTKSNKHYTNIFYGMLERGKGGKG